MAGDSWLMTNQGRTSLGKTTLKIVSASECQHEYPKADLASTFCANGRPEPEGACEGDAGAPFIMDGNLAGIASMNAPGYGKSTFSLFTATAAFKEWIKTTVGREYQSTPPRAYK